MGSADALYGKHGGRSDDGAGSRERVQHAVAAPPIARMVGASATATSQAAVGVVTQLMCSHAMAKPASVPTKRASSPER